MHPRKCMLLALVVSMFAALQVNASVRSSHAHHASAFKHIWQPITEGSTAVVKNISSLLKLTHVSRATVTDPGQGGNFYFKKLNVPGKADGGMVFYSAARKGLWYRSAVDSTRLNVKWFGAKGDSTTDDKDAIRAAAATLDGKLKRELYFPAGTYRYGRYDRTYQGAIELIGLSHITLSFDPAATLLMDNLNQSTRKGDREDGIFIKGPATDIRLVNVHIRWKDHAVERSQGSGLMIKGYPGSSGPSIINVTLENCTIENTPQVAALLMGCDSVTVHNFISKNTVADGLHFNACRNVNIKSVKGYHNGDDVLAFVTYYDAADIKGSGSRSPYFQPSLGEWSNTNITVDQVYGEGGNADVVRIAGAKNIRINEVTGLNMNFGVQIDAGTTSGNYIWTYTASQKIAIHSIKADNCRVGLFIRSFNGNIEDDAFKKYTDFDVNIDKVEVHRTDAPKAGTYGIRLYQVQGVHIGTCLVTTQGDINDLNKVINVSIDTLVTNGSRCVLKGVTNGKSSGVAFRKIQINNEGLMVDSMYDCTMGDVSIVSPKKDGLYLQHSRNISLNNLQVSDEQPNTLGDGRYFLINACKDITVRSYSLVSSNVQKPALEVGGGSNNDNRCQNISINAFHFKNGSAGSFIGGVQPKFVIQGGPYQPVNLNFSGRLVSKPEQIQSLLK